MPPQTTVLGDGTVGGEKPLRVTRGREPLRRREQGLRRLPIALASDSRVYVKFVTVPERYESTQDLSSVLDAPLNTTLLLC